jgi:hypothetical protein
MDVNHFFAHIPAYCSARRGLITMPLPVVTSGSQVERRFND